MLAAGVVYVENTLVRGEGYAVGGDEVAYEQGDLVEVGGDHVHAGVVEIQTGSGGARVGEVYVAVGLDYDVVGAVEAGAAVPVGYDGDFSVGVLAGDAARAVFAGEQASLEVAGESVGVVGGLLEEGYAFVGVPLHAPVVVYVAEQEIAAVAPPEWPFGWAVVAAEAVGQFLYVLVGGEQAVEVVG